MCVHLLKGASTHERLAEVTLKCGVAIFDTVRAAGGNSPADSHHVTQWNVMGVIVSEAFSASVRTAHCG